MRRGRRSCFLVFKRSQAKNRRTEHDFLSGRSWRCGGFFVVGRWCFIMAPGTRRTVSGPGYWWIPETIPLSSRKNAKGGEQGTQLACGSNKCPLFSNAFSREPRGSHASGIRHPCPEAVLRWGMGDMEKRKKKKEVPCWGIEEGKPADINLSKGHYRKILKCGILACKDNYRGIIYDSEKKEY